MKALLFSFFAGIFLAGLICSSRADEVVASYDFSNGPDKWTGRTADTKNLPQPTIRTDAGSKDPNKPYLSVKTDGRLGTGLRLNQSISVVKGQSYLLTFWVKVADPIPVAYRLIATTMDGPDYAYADTGGQWRPITDLPAKQWTQVSYTFTAAVQEPIGLDIAAGADHTPTELSIYDPKVTLQVAKGTPVATYDFSAGPGPWSGRTADNLNLPAVQVQTESAVEPGKPYLSVQTDGKLGTGFRLQQSVPVTPDSPYLFSVWVRISKPAPISYRIIGADVSAGDFEYGDKSGTWHLASELVPNKWTKVTFPFTATVSPIGLDLTAGADHSPMTLSIYDPEIISVTPSANP